MAGPGERPSDDAILAALDFEPADDPFRAARRRAPRGRRLALFAVLHVACAVTFGLELADGVAVAPVVVAGLAWAAGTVVLVRTLLRLLSLREPATG